MVFREDVRPLWRLRCGCAINDPEASRLLDDGNLFGFAGRYLPTGAEEADLSGFLDDASVVDREVEIE